MSANPDWDPFHDETEPSPAEFSGEYPEEKMTVAEVEEAAVPGNGLSVTFKAHGGYDAPWVTARGSAEYLAGLFNVKDFDGKISTLMSRVVEIDAYYKKAVGAPAGKG